MGENILGRIFTGDILIPVPANYGASKPLPSVEIGQISTTDVASYALSMMSDDLYDYYAYSHLAGMDGMLGGLGFDDDIDEDGDEVY